MPGPEADPDGEDAMMREMRPEKDAGRHLVARTRTRLSLWRRRYLRYRCIDKILINFTGFSTSRHALGLDAPSRSACACRRICELGGREHAAPAPAPQAALPSAI